MITDKLVPLRDELDDIDGRIVDALAARTRVVRAISQVKSDSGEALRDPPREQEVLSRLSDRARAAGLDAHFVTRLFREIIDHAIRRQQGHLLDAQNAGESRTVMVVGFQGTEGAYGHLAARTHFETRDGDLVYRAYETLGQMLEAVQAGAAHYAVLPIENTTAGSINEAYDLLARMNLSIVGEEIQSVDHCLIALEPVPLGRIRRIYAHSQALAQCTDFLTTLEHCHVESLPTMALAVEKIRDDQDLSQAAIGSEEAAGAAGLHVLTRGIANQRENYTRFVIVAGSPVRCDRRIACKTSLVFATRHEQGALVSCLNVLATHGLNLTKLESRPRPNTPWEYLFYVDVDGNTADPAVEDAIRELSARAVFLKVLGSYPARTTRESQVASAVEPGFESSSSLVPAIEDPAVPAPAPAPRAPDPGARAYRLASREHRSEDTEIRIGGVTVGGARPIVIAGPCSVESREQIFACAEVVKAAGGDMLRGGVFKPRTSPYAFQGLGYDGLDLLEEAGHVTGLPIVTEVMHPSDVARVARKAQVLQIGARNMQNFSLLKEVGRVDRPIILKRGLMASIDEWLSAAEYILAQGNQQVILCERGIRTFETATRNTLDLGAIPVVRERTHLPVIVDPSHAIGVARWIPPLAEAAFASGAQGIMIEIHPKPSEALSDGPQALEFPIFRELMDRLRRRAAVPVAR